MHDIVAVDTPVAPPVRAGWSTVVLTPKGEATRRLYAFLRAAKALGAEDREDVLQILAEEVADIPTA